MEVGLVRRERRFSLHTGALDHWEVSIPEAERGNDLASAFGACADTLANLSRFETQLLNQLTRLLRELEHAHAHAESQRSEPTVRDAASRAGDTVATAFVLTSPTSSGPGRNGCR